MLFNHVVVEWKDCMDTCTNYRGAQAPSFSTEAGLQELITWSQRTVTDPETNEDYEDYISQTFYIPFT